MRKAQKKISAVGVLEQSVKSELRRIDDNFTEIFKRLNASRFALSGACDLFSTTNVKPDYVAVDNLSVKINTTGIRPVMIMLMQDAKLFDQGTRGGGINLEGTLPCAAFLIKNHTVGQFIWATTLGSYMWTLAAAAIGTPYGRHFISPSAIFAIDEFPSEGIQHYELFTAAENFGVVPFIGTTVNISFLRLAAMELF